ncbi:hypothetical protein B7486_56890, partial [cyanobacterium TDX16]
MKRTTLVLAALALGLGALLLVPGAASAHDDNADLTFESDPVGDAGPLSLDLRVGATYSIDGEQVEAATMSVTGTGPDGATLPATPLEPVPETVGLYGAELAFPVGGAWSLTVTSTDPAGELAVQVDVPEGSGTTTAAEEPTPTTVEPESDESIEEQAE